VDDSKDNVPSTSAALDAGATEGPDPTVGGDGVERQLASVSGIMSASEFTSLSLTGNTQKVGTC
jgi:hypothetical protein